MLRAMCESFIKSVFRWRGRDEVYLVQRGESGEENGVHIVGVGEPTGGRLGRMFSFSRKVYEAALAVDAELYHFHDPELLPYGLKLKRLGKRVVFDCHEKYTEQLRRKPYLPSWCTKLLARVYGWYEVYALKRIDGLIFPCLKEGKNPFAGQCRHFATVNNVPRLEELYDRYDPTIPKHENSVVHVGSLSHARGITHLVEAAELADCTVYLGGLYESVDYQARVESLPGYRSVRYLGKLSRPQVLQTLQESLVGMATLLNVGQYNQYDNLATKVYEYMSLGLPVVLTRSQYNQWAVDTYGFGICVNPEDVKETADAIRQLLDNPEMARRMGENGRRAVKETFHWEAEAEKLLCLYADILNN